MNKIIKLALGLSYPQDKLSALQEVISATPNPPMATEILLGVYEKPKLPFKVKNSKGDIWIKKESNDWTEKVQYTYLQNKRIGAYYPKGTVEKELNDSNWESKKAKSSDENTAYLYFTSNEKEEKTGECSYQEWLSCTDITPKRELENLYAE